MQWIRNLFAPPVVGPPDLTEAERLAGDVVTHLVLHRKMSTTDAEAVVVDVLDALLVLPEPLDTLSDAGIEALIGEISESLRRKPERMRQRASRLHRDGHRVRAAKLLQRAALVEARRAQE
jgi:hypothetical protein